MMNQESERKKFLQLFLSDVQYEMVHPTIVKVSFAGDIDHKKLWMFEKMMREFYGAYATGPISTFLRPGFMSFGFKDQEALNFAREELGLPDELQPGSPIFIGPYSEKEGE
jgi:hypothetical protein